MRIKKKSIKEDLGKETEDNIAYVKSRIEGTAKELEDDLDIAPEVAAPAAVEFVSGALKAVNDKKNESVNPMMTKSELIETVLRTKQNRKVIKTLKVKDLK